MNHSSGVFIGTDSGATTSKTGGVWADGTLVSPKLRQSATNAHAGTKAVVCGWIDGITAFLAENQLTWAQVAGVGLAIPGLYVRRGVLGRAANLPSSFEEWDVHTDYSRALEAAAGRPIPLVVGNDGNFGGVAEAARVRGDRRAGVLMLAAGSGLGCAYIDPSGLPLEGDTLAGMEAGHMPAPLHLLGLKPFRCGCGRDWGCVESYTTLSGLPQLLDAVLEKYPDHELATSTASPQEKALSLRSRAQRDDPLAIEIFALQAKTLGIHVASLTMAFDAEFVVIGGGLMDPGATTVAFRERYLAQVREAASRYFFPAQRRTVKIVPATLGELSQAIGAALAARFTAAGPPPPAERA